MEDPNKRARTRRISKEWAEGGGVLCIDFGPTCDAAMLGDALDTGRWGMHVSIDGPMRRGGMGRTSRMVAGG